MVVSQTNKVDVIEKSLDLKVVKKAGGSIIQHPGVFSEDSRYLFITWGNSIRAYNVETGDFVTSYEGLLKDAVGVSLHPSISDKIIAISYERELIEWQCTKQANYRFHSDRKIQLGNRKGKFVVLSFSLIHFEEHENPCAVCVIKVDGQRDAEVKTFCIATGSEKNVFRKIRADSNNHSLSVRHANSETLMAVICNSSSSFVTFCIKYGSEVKMTQAVSKNRFTCVACHPSEHCVITGDIIGCIRVWCNLLGRPTFAPYHWHTLPVESLVFSASGSYFYSGGGECVLVKWLLESPTEKRFLPRLSAEIACLTISPDNSFVAISTQDNGIQLIDSSNRLFGTIQHFSWSVLSSHGKSYSVSPSEMTFDPRTKSLVMNARAGHIQFFSVEQGNVLFLLDVVCQNYLTQERSKLIKNSEVIKFAFNTDGCWLTTAESCENEGNTPAEIRLKFWEFDKIKQMYTLNTSVENPHRGKIFAIRFRPSSNQELMCITTGEDMKFRTWLLQEIPFVCNKSQIKYHWKIENVGYYRNLPVKELSFSVDGSLMAVTFGPTLTVWVPGVNQIKCSLTSPDAKENLIHVAFGQKSVHLIVTGSTAKLAVWNLLSLSLLWVVPFNLSVLVSDPQSDCMAAFSSTNDVVVFSPNCHEPIFKKNSLLSLTESAIVNAVFIPHTSNKSKGRSWQSSSQLYLFNSKQELFCLEDPMQDSAALEGQNLDVMPKPFKSQTAYGALLAEQSRSDVANVQNKHHQQLGTPGLKSLHEFLEAPAHTMPPLSLLGYSLLMSFISTKEEESGNSSSRKFSLCDNRMEISSESEDNSDIELPFSKTSFEERKQDALEIQQSCDVTSTLDIAKQLDKITDHTFDWVSHLLT